MKYEVRNRFFDAPRGAYVDPGEDWTPADKAQAKRLFEAGCVVPLKAPKAPAAPPKAPPKGKASKGADGASDGPPGDE